jgi:hypothetical protein
VRREALETGLTDNTKMRWLQSDGSYLRATPLTGEEKCDFQTALLAPSLTA